MSRKGAETQRDAHCFTLTRWVNACLSASASSLRLCAFARHPIAGFRFICSSAVRESDHPLRCARLFWAAVFSDGALSVVSVGIENEDGTVFAADLDRLAGFGVLVGKVGSCLRVVVCDPFADGLPRRLDGLERVDVEWRGWRWRDGDDRLMSLPLHPSACLRQSMSAPLPFPKSVESEEELDFSRTASDRVPLRLPMADSFDRWIHRAAQWRF